MSTPSSGPDVARAVKRLTMEARKILKGGPIWGEGETVVAIREGVNLIQSLSAERDALIKERDEWRAQCGAEERDKDDARLKWMDAEGRADDYKAQLAALQRKMGEERQRTIEECASIIGDRSYQTAHSTPIGHRINPSAGQPHDARTGVARQSPRP